jgi:hypothetical protein
MSLTIIAHAHAVGSIGTPHTKVTPSKRVETWTPVYDGQHPHRRGTDEQAIDIQASRRFDDMWRG